MKAATYTRYGTADVIEIRDVARPRPGKGEILVRVRATGVTTADWRLRAAAFPGLISKVAGRLMFGLFRPRKQILGHDVAGTVAETGPGVTGFSAGDRVFGFSDGGAHAEYVVMKADGAVLHTPDGITDTEAAALPFGGLGALEFIERFGRVRAGERVLVIGATGGVGAYAVQVASALGAVVTGVASAPREALVRDLGAAQFVDYRATDVARLEGPYDVIFDTIGVLKYPRGAAMLAQGGRFIPLNFGLLDALQTRRAKRNGHEVVLKVNGDTKEGLKRLTDLIAQGRLRPVVDEVYPFAAIRDAYGHVESRSRKGAVVLDLANVVAVANAA